MKGDAVTPSCREVEEELEAVWQAATRDKKQPFDKELVAKTAQGSGPQRHRSLDELQKNGMDFYC